MPRNAESDPVTVAARNVAKAKPDDLAAALARMTRCAYGFQMRGHDNPPLQHRAFLGLMIPPLVLPRGAAEHISSKEWVLPEAHVSVAPWVAAFDHRCARIHTALDTEEGDAADVAVALLGRDTIDELSTGRSDDPKRVLSALRPGVLKRLRVLNWSPSIAVALRPHRAITSLSFCTQDTATIVLIRSGLPVLQHLKLSEWDLRTGDGNKFFAQLTEVPRSTARSTQSRKTDRDGCLPAPEIDDEQHDWERALVPGRNTAQFLPSTLTSLTLMSCTVDNAALTNVMAHPSLLELHYATMDGTASVPIPPPFAARARAISVELLFPRKVLTVDSTSGTAPLPRLKTLRQFVSDPVLKASTSVVDLGLRGSDCEELMAAALRFENVQKLTVSLVSWECDLGPLAGLKHLTSLQVIGGFVDDLLAITQPLPLVQELEVRGHVKEGSLVDALTAAALPSLRRLVLQGDWKGPVCIRLAQWAGSMHGCLERLFLRNMRTICDEAVEQLHMKTFGNALCYVLDVTPFGNP